ncbi:MAG: YlxR family protein [Lachnospiraceae bacterium]|nr:YlxR family protein [Lachnospiraceae bacterium]
MSTIKKIPMRKCTGCGELKPKKELIRVIKNGNSEVMLDLTGKMNGRGAYVCRSMECLTKAVRTKAIERSLQISISQEVYDKLKAELDNEG